METLDKLWTMRGRIETAFSKDDLTTISRDALNSLISSLYDDICELTDNNTAWWDRDDDIKKLNLNSHEREND